MRNTVSFALVLLGAVGLPAATAGQDESPLQVHGYMTQGWGIADGGTFAGVPEGGTADYRNLAIQFRYGMSRHDNLTFQFSHRRLGANAIVVGEPDVKLDWAFYGRQAGALSFRVGRIPIPAGIYNEVRDVGVLLPLYRAPFNFYLEGAFTSETVDGAVASYELFSGAPWSLEVSGYYGRYDMINRANVGGTYVPVPTNVDEVVGGQAWLNTPVDGVRFGGGISTQQVEQGDFAGTWTIWHASADVSLSRVTARAEYRSFDLPVLDYVAYYGYLGVNVTHQLTLHGQADFADLTYGPLPQLDMNDAYTAGISFAFRPNLVLKGEMHFTEGYWSDVPVLDPTSQSPASVRYALISLSTAF